MFGLGVGIAQGGQRLRPVAQITADFIKNRYRGGVGPAFFDLFDFVAAGNRTYINALGHMATAGVNEPRTGHHVYRDGKWMPVGLLLEPDGDNFLTDNTGTVFNGSGSGGVNMTPSSSVRNGLNFVRYNSNGVQAALVYWSLTVTPGETYTFSYLLNLGTITKPRAAIYDETHAGWVSGYSPAFIDLTNREEFGGGTILITTTVTAPAGCTSMRFYPLRSDNQAEASGTAEIAAWQVEVGSVASSRILTSGTPLSRAKDSLEISALTIAKLLVKHNRAPELADPDLQVASNSSAIRNGDGFDVTATGNFMGIRQDNVVEAGKSYLISLEWSGNTAASSFAYMNGFTDLTAGLPNSADEGSVEMLGTATGHSLLLFFSLSSLGDQKYMRIKSVKEVTMPTRYGPDIKASFTNAGPSNWSESGNVHTRSSTGWNRLVFPDQELGKTYRLQGRVVRHSGAAAVFVFRQAIGGAANEAYEILAMGDGAATFDITLAYIEDIGNVGVFIDANDWTGTVELYSVEEVIQDLSLSMKGLMSYADENGPFGKLANWEVDSSNRIVWDLTSFDPDTGRILFRQAEAGILSTVSTPSSVYAPGASVPFSIASYHSNRGINGAHEETVLSAQSSFKLPNLRGAPIQIAPTGIVTLAKFNLFLGVSGDDLLEELVQ